MDILVVQKSVTEVECDALIVNLCEGVQTPGGATAAIDTALDGVITEMIASGELTGKLGQTVILRGNSAINARRVIVVGLGKADDFDLDRARQAAAAAARTARTARCQRVASIAHGGGSGFEPEAVAQATVEGAILGLYRFKGHHRNEAPDHTPREFVLVERDAKKIERVAAGAKKGRVTAEATAWARDMVNEPANFMTPTHMAEAAKAMASEVGLECTILEEADMEREGMGSLLGVSRGSDEPAKLIVLKHDGGSETLALVGKALTFDSGGISLKPGDGMERMKNDMAGGAAVLAAMRIIAQLQPKLTVYGIVAATENLPSGRALKPGDVLRALNGKTIEIISTDAEGRLVLADAVAHADRLGAERIVDVATLTGACSVALGNQAAALIVNNDDLGRQVKQAGAQAGERVWELPSFPEYKEQLKSDVADLKNSGGRPGGTITGGLFIGEFAGERAWAHIDIASTAWTEQETGYRVKGATGMATRLLAQLAMNLAAK